MPREVITDVARILALFTFHDSRGTEIQLTNVQFAQLAHSDITITTQNKPLCKAVIRWKKGQVPMPLAVYELVAAKQAAIRRGLTTLEELCEGQVTLDKVLFRRRRKKGSG